MIIQVGMSFGKWQILSPHTVGKYGGVYKWLCRCSCGKEKPVASCHLKNGASTGCGCDRRERFYKVITKHGKVKTPEYSSWQNMKTRCYNKKIKEYKYYGGKGIRVCKRWIDSYENFYNDMGPKPDKTYSVDRIDLNGDYSPDNCRWASRIQQANNKTNNRIIVMDGESHALAEWCRIKNKCQKKSSGLLCRGTPAEKVFL